MFPLYSRVLPAALALALGMTTCSARVRASEDPEPLRVDLAVDGTVTGAALATGIALTFLPVKGRFHWDRELLGADYALRGRSSTRAARTSDVTIWLAVAVPLLGLWLDSPRRVPGPATLVYAEAHAVNAMLTSATKVLVQRPRPYTYSDDAVVATHGGRDRRHSFISGHSSVGFTSAVAGSYLYGASQCDPQAAAAMWGAELLLASFTATLRVRAGKHFYSDVLAGSLVGTGLGILIPRLHMAEGARYVPTWGEWLAIGGGLVAGTSLGHVLPFRDTLDGTRALPPLTLAPLPLRGGIGVGVSGSF